MTDTLIRAWKDQQFRESLPSDTRAALEANPAGELAELDHDIGAAVGGEGRTEYLFILGCCQGLTDACIGWTVGVVYCTGTCLSIWMTTDAMCAAK